MTLVQKEIKRITIRPTLPRLPSAYQEIEYIQTVGNQWIDTGLFASNDYQTETKVETTTTETEKCLFGSLSNGTTSDSWSYYNLINYLGEFYWGGIGGGTNHGGSFPSTAGIQYEIVFNNSSNKVVVDGSIIGDCTGEVGYTGSTLCISARGGTNQRYYGKYKYFYFNVYDKVNSTYIRKMIPCYRKSDSVVGMYDLVNDTFYTNAGSGTFTKGSDISYEKQIRPTNYVYTYNFIDAGSIAQMQSDGWTFDNAGDREITANGFHKKSGGDQAAYIHIKDLKTAKKITMTYDIYVVVGNWYGYMGMGVGGIGGSVRANTNDGNGGFGAQTGTNNVFNTSVLSTGNYTLTFVLDLVNKVDTASLTGKTDVSAVITDTDIANMTGMMHLYASGNYVYVKNMSIIAEL